jgi:hypothetical protein
MNFKKLIPWTALFPLLMAGCSTPAILTNLTPQTQDRSSNNFYIVEVALASRQQTLRWDSIKPRIVVGDEFYAMRPVRMMTNRWEGLLPVPSGTNVVHYHYKFDYNYNAMGAPRTDSARSPEYILRIQDDDGSTERRKK